MTEINKYYFTAKVSQNNGGKGGSEGRIYTLEDPNNPHFQKITAQTPMDFNGPSENGHSLYWTPENLFVAAASVCLQSTFVTVAENSKLQYNGFEVTSTATLVREGEKPGFISEIVKNVIVSVPDEKYKRRAEKVVHLAEKRCIIGNSIKSKIILNVEIKVE